MLNYSSMVLEELDSGITDDFKSDAVKFNLQENLVPSENRSLRLRNGISVFDHVGNATDSVVHVDTIDNKPIQMIGHTSTTSVKVFDRLLGKYDTPVDIKGFGSLNDYVISSDEWRSALFFNATDSDGNTADIGRIVLSDAGLVAEKASLPKPSVVPSNTAAGRLWSVVIERTYTDVNGFTYREYSPDAFGSFSSTNGTYTFNVTISTPSTDYQSSLNAVLFVSTINGTVLYRAASLAIVGTTATLTFTTSASTDSTLVTREIGQFFSEEAKIPLPKADHIKIVNNTMWLLGITDTDGTRRPYRLYQSVSGMPTSVIANAFYDFQSNGTGLANLNGKLIVGTDGFVYRVDGSIGIDGTGNIQAEAIIGSDQGCIAGRSMVAVGNNLFYCGNDGVYSTDGFTATNITGRQLYKTYRDLIGNSSDWRNIKAAYDSFDDLIYWVMPDGRLLMLSLRSGGFSTGTTGNMGIRSIKACNIPVQSLVGTSKNVPMNGVVEVNNPYNFTQGAVYWFVTKEAENPSKPLEVYSISGNQLELRAANATPVAYEIENNQPIYEYGEGSSSGALGVVYRQHVLMASDLGYTVSFRDDYKSDVVLEKAETDVSLLSRTSRQFKLLSAGISYDAPNDHKWVKDVTFNLRSNGVISAVPYTITDNRSLAQRMGEIISNNRLVPFDKFNIYNRQSMEFDAKGIQTFRRHIPSGSCKCRFNQIGIESVATNLYSSLEYSVVTVAQHPTDTNKVVMTMQNRFSDDSADDIKFPRNITGMSISIAQTTRLICKDLVSVVNNADGTTDITWTAFSVDPSKVLGVVFDGTDISGSKYQSGTVVGTSATSVTIRFTNTLAYPSEILDSVYFTPKKSRVDNWSSKVQILSVDTITEQELVAYKPSGVDIVTGYYEFVIYGTPVDQDIEIVSIGLDFANLSNSNAGKKASSNMSGGFNGR